MKNSMESLLGMWRTDDSSAETFSSYGDVVMDFHCDGSLVYTIIDGDVEKKLYLEFNVEGDQIVTDQPSRPNEQRTAFEIVAQRLILTSASGIGIFKRI